MAGWLYSIAPSELLTSDTHGSLCRSGKVPVYSGIMGGPSPEGCLGTPHIPNGHFGNSEIQRKSTWSSKRVVTGSGLHLL
jgi:hypothetical protein